jgi:hypothetical protein
MLSKVEHTIIKILKKENTRLSVNKIELILKNQSIETDLHLNIINLLKKGFIIINKDNTVGLSDYYHAVSNSKSVLILLDSYLDYKDYKPFVEVISYLLQENISYNTIMRVLIELERERLLSISEKGILKIPI